MNTLNDAASLDRDHLREQRLDALGGATAQVAFATLGAHYHARPGDSEAFRGRLMGLQFLFGCCLLARHRLYSFSHKTPLEGQNRQPHRLSRACPRGNFRMKLSGFLLYRLGRSQDHHHAAPLHDWGLLNGGKVRQLFGNFLQVI